MRLLKGGAACLVHRVDLIGGPYRSVVLKQFPPGNGGAELEWQALRFARRCLVASPDPVAFDLAGEWFGTPAIWEPGVCDWASARMAPRLSDVGRCRAALCVWPGGEAPDLFRDHYARMTGRPMQGLALWDLFSAYLSLQSVRNLMPMYDVAGVELTVEVAMARVSALADRAAAEARLFVR